MFGIFKNKKSEPLSELLIDSFTEQQWELQETVFNEYKLGMELDYMGVKIRITRHTHYCRPISSKWVSLPTVYPGISCDYVNKSGQIERVSFSCSEVITWKKPCY